jgi:YidC/Oxa1 family membrane protein insertase
MIAISFFEGPAWVLAKFYDWTHDYILAITLIAFLVMLITAPLQLKATKGMLEMQRLQPELRKLQQQYRSDRQKLNEEMMKLYQAHKVNPLASCFPLLLQLPVFIIMFQVLHGLTEKIPGREGFPGFTPEFVSSSSQIYKDLVGDTEMLSWGLDLAKTPINAINDSLAGGLVYALLVVALGALYLVQQKMVAARASVSPTMSPMQQKIMQYLPVFFAVFLVFYLTGLVIYYMAQAIFRIGLQWYITRRFYKGEQSLGRQAMAAGEEAREIAKNDPNGGLGIFGQAKRDAAAAKEASAKKASGPTSSKRVTPPKNKPTPSTSKGRPPSSGKAGRPPSTKPPKS